MPGALPRSTIRSLVWDIVLNATIPTALYLLAKHFAASEFSALLWATAFPFLKSAYDLIRRRDLDPVALIVLLGLVTSMIAVLASGNSRLLLIRESFFTGAFGLACLISLLFPRPLMFYFGRYFMAGKDEQRRETFNARWHNPVVRRAHRLVTATWGLVYVGEFLLRLALVYQFPASIVLAVTPFLTGLATVGAIIGTFWYASRVRERIDAAARTGAACLVLVVATLARPAFAQDTSVAPSFLVDPSPRSSAMGGASGAVLWGEPNSWANPAMLGLGAGIRYSWSEAALTPAVPNRAYDRVRNITLEYGGLGLELAGTPSLLRGPTYDGQLLIGEDVNGNLLGFFSYAESVEVVSGGIALLHAAETVATATHLFRIPPLSRYGEVSLGWRSKKVSSGFFVNHVTLHDVGWLVRLTPYNAIDSLGFGHWPALDRKAAVRVDLAYGQSTQNSGDGTLFTWSTRQVEPIPELRRHALAARLAVGTSRRTALAWIEGRLGWMLDFVSPCITLGYARDQVVPTRRGPSAIQAITGPTVHRTGWELSIADLFSYRWGRIDDPDAGIVGNTSGFGVGVAYRRTCGIRFDWASVPRQAGSSSTRQKGATVYVDPLAVWQSLR